MKLFNKFLCWFLDHDVYIRTRIHSPAIGKSEEVCRRRGCTYQKLIEPMRFTKSFNH